MSESSENEHKFVCSSISPIEKRYLPSPVPERGPSSNRDPTKILLFPPMASFLSYFR